jgi:hypothetical protein
MWLIQDHGQSWLPSALCAAIFVLDMAAFLRAVVMRRVVSGWSFPLLGVLLLFLSLLVMPCVDSAGPEALEVECRNNVLAVGRGLLEYIDLNRGQVPGMGRWCDVLLEDGYLTDPAILKCPAAGEARSSYGINSGVAGKRPDGSPQTVLLFEIDGGWNVSGGRERMIAEPRHPGGFMFLFANGEVKAVPKKELGQLEW